MKTIILVMTIFSITITSLGVAAKQITCRLDDQILEGNFPANIKINVGEKYSGQFSLNNEVFRWTILPDGVSVMTADGNETNYAALYRCDVLHY